MTKSITVVIALVLAGSIAPVGQARSAAPAGCYQCMAIYDEASHQVLQACPGSFSSGGLQCVVQGNRCRTTGTCSP